MQKEEVKSISHWGEVSFDGINSLLPIQVFQINLLQLMQDYIYSNLSARNNAKKILDDNATAGIPQDKNTDVS